jgi:enoyl-CoA hydratase/carnithine racemase
MDNLIISEENQGVFTITLNRLSKKNALNSLMYKQLGEHLVCASNSPSIRCVLIQGDQNCFCAGNDLQDFIESAKTNDLAALGFIKILSAFDKPIVAAVAGPVVGIGTTLLLHCDMVIAANNSKFKLPFTQLGLCPEAGSSLLLPMRIGQNRAFELLVLGKTFNAEQALQYGLVNEVCTPEALLSTAQTLSHTIAALPYDALMTSRRLLKDAAAQLLPDAMANEAKEFIRLMKTDDCKSILAKFFE